MLAIYARSFHRLEEITWLITTVLGLGSFLLHIGFFFSLKKRKKKIKVMRDFVVSVSFSYFAENTTFTIMLKL